VLRMTRAPDYGRYRILLDGTDVTTLEDYPTWNRRGPQDFYAREVEVRDLYLGSFAFTPGAHTLRFESVGRSPGSGGTALGLDSVRLRQRWQKLRKPLRPATP
jgi:hypothetical protein